MLKTGASPTAGGKLRAPAPPGGAAELRVWLQARQGLRGLERISMGRDNLHLQDTGRPSQRRWCQSRLRVCGYFLGHGMPESLEGGREAGRAHPRVSGGSVALGLLDFDPLASRTGREYTSVVVSHPVMVLLWQPQDTDAGDSHSPILHFLEFLSSWKEDRLDFTLPPPCCRPHVALGIGPSHQRGVQAQRERPRPRLRPERHCQV